MSWAVGWDSDHRRFRGYGVPAYCDARGCLTEIDRGLGYVCECDREIDEEACWALDAVDKSVFVCGEHTCGDVDVHHLPPEHPDWIKHISTDPSWDRWRRENPQRIADLRDQLARAGAGSAAYLNADGTDFMEH